ncbi:hypothetical protein FOA52_011572 [Chlamydomonas sp. UWO 241]|nr:hypothetical protein FOA52_011572 [Chlamydomonas sp. UWO 241]
MAFASCPAKAVDVLKQLSVQVTMEVYRNMILMNLLSTVQQNIRFVADPDGELKGPNGEAWTRVMESAELSDYEGDEGEEPRVRLHERLGMTLPWLLSNFGQFVFRGSIHSPAVYGVDHKDLIFGVTVGIDPLADKNFKELKQLVCGARGREG